jgi:7,8-didemethyl-8-hydroxy-5-deazariboflavin synthase CofH subunit
MHIPAILKDVSRGRDLTPQEFCDLFLSQGYEDEILACAHQVNLGLHGDRVSFVHNRNLNYTNLCINHCSFCGFRRNPGEPGGYRMSIDDLLAKIAETPGVSEVCIQGGLTPELGFPSILEMLRSIKGQFPHIHIHAFSPMELHYFSQRAGIPLTATLEALMASGLDSFPGTAAEILDDALRRELCPEKGTVATWINVVTTAHRMGLKSTATILFGHIETPFQIARHLQILRDIQRDTHGFTELVPLPFVPYHTSLGNRYHVTEMLSFDRIRLFYALCRLFYRDLIPNLQSSWPKLGLNRALECVLSGVNDVGGTLYQENITRSAGGIHGEKVSLRQFYQGIRAVGKIPRLRTTLYEFPDDPLLISLMEEESGSGIPEGKKNAFIKKERPAAEERTSHARER